SPPIVAHAPSPSAASVTAAMPASCFEPIVIIELPVYAGLAASRRESTKGMMPLIAAGSNSYVSETVARDFLAAIDVAQVDEKPAGHRGAEARKVKGPEGVPFGDDGDRIGAFGRGIGAVLHLDLGHHRCCDRHAFRIIGGDACAGVEQGLDDCKARRI